MHDIVPLAFELLRAQHQLDRTFVAESGGGAREPKAHAYISVRKLNSSGKKPFSSRFAR
jgi:hypothetical protein